MYTLAQFSPTSDGGIFDIFLENLRTSKLTHVSCHTLSQIGVIKKLLPFQAVIIFLLMILNTDLTTRYLRQVQDMLADYSRSIQKL